MINSVTTATCKLLMGPFRLTIVMEAPEREALNCTLGPSYITSDSDTTPYCKKINIDPDGSPPVGCIMLCVSFHIPEKMRIM